jgi:hypothetical protein
MKKILLSLVLVALMTNGDLLAQQESGRHNRFGGIRGGYQGAALVMDGNNYQGSDTYTTFYVGIQRDNKLGAMFYHGSGLDYFQTGVQMGDNKDLMLHYISLPNHLKIKIGPVYALGGLAPSFRVAEREVIAGDAQKPDENMTGWFDIPAYAGVGIKIFFLNVEARYHWGLVDVMDGYYNRYFQLGAGISF